MPLSDIKDIQFVGGGNIVRTTPTEGEQTTIAARLCNITNRILEQLLGTDTANLEKIRANQLVSRNELSGKKRI